jgi:hypothetical protein
VIDAATLERWIQKIGFDPEVAGEATMRLVPRNGAHADLPPFFLQHSPNWIMLSVLPVFEPTALLPDDLNRRLLSVNRDMRIAKFALGEDDEVVLCAELPTESLDYSELSDVVERLVKYFNHYREYLVKP